MRIPIHQAIEKIWQDSQTMTAHEVVVANKKILTDCLFNLLSVNGNEMQPPALGTMTEALDFITNDICRVFDLTPKQLKCKKRDYQIAIPRHIATFIARYFNTATFEAIGKYMGERDHTTIINSFRVIKGCLEVQDERFYPYWKKYVLCGDPLITKYFNLYPEAELAVA